MASLACRPSLQFRDCLCCGLQPCFTALCVCSLTLPSLSTSRVYLCFWHPCGIETYRFIWCCVKREAFPSACCQPSACFSKQRDGTNRQDFWLKFPACFTITAKAEELAGKESETISPFSHGLSRCCHSGATG